MTCLTAFVTDHSTPSAFHVEMWHFNFFDFCRLDL